MDWAIFSFWLLGAVLVGQLASRWGYGWIFGFIISIIFSPLLSLIFFMISGNNKPKCPSCKGYVDKNASRCTHCSQAFKIKPEPNTEVIQEVKSQSSNDETECPFCAELIKQKAIKCRFCHSDLTTPETE
ncbi:MAG: hypothetical protein MJK12_17590 [Colwellia sp.]|nr:hypothetical protein [Colwellia sp.]